LYYDRRTIRRTGADERLITAGWYAGLASKDKSALPDGTLADGDQIPSLLGRTSDRRRKAQHRCWFVHRAGGDKFPSPPSGTPVRRWWKTITAGLLPVEIVVTHHRRLTPTGPKTDGNGGSGAGGE